MPDNTIHPARLFSQNASALVMYASQWVDRSQAEDVVQDVFGRLVDGRPWPDDPRPWLFRSVRNAVIDHARRQKLEVETRKSLRASLHPGPSSSVDVDAVHAALAGLDMIAREVVVLRIWAGLTLEQISRVQECSLSSVHRRYTGAIEQLEDTLSHVTLEDVR